MLHVCLSDLLSRCLLTIGTSWYLVMIQICLRCLLSRYLLTNGTSRYLAINASSLFELPANEWNKPPGIDNVLYVRWKRLGLKDYAINREPPLCDVCLNGIPAFYCGNDVCAFKNR